MSAKFGSMQSFARDSQMEKETECKVEKVMRDSFPEQPPEVRAKKFVRDRVRAPFPHLPQDILHTCGHGRGPSFQQDPRVWARLEVENSLSLWAA